MLPEIVVVEDEAELARTVAGRFAEHARTSIEARGRFFVALAGGSTPKAAYALLASPAYRDSVAWERVRFFFGDERCVPPNHEQSNYKMAFETFIGPLEIPEAHVHRMRGEDDPAAAAIAYRGVLFEELGENPSFDLVMLGIGPDGHTASLFPGQDPLAEDEEKVRAVYSESQSQWRITLTPSVLNAAQVIVFSAEGPAKADVIAAVRQGPYAPDKWPAQIIAPADGELIWLVDKAAAGKP